MWGSVEIGNLSYARQHGVWRYRLWSDLNLFTTKDTKVHEEAVPSHARTCKALSYPQQRFDMSVPSKIPRALQAQFAHLGTSCLALGKLNDFPSQRFS
jgi:hypothetical protein